MTAHMRLLLVLDLAGIFLFALNGAFVATRLVRLDIVGVIGLGMTTALGGGVVRDVLLGALPPSSVRDWRYLTVAAVGGLAAFLLASHLGRLTGPITVLDAAGLSLFAVTGATKALAYGLGIEQAVLLGTLTAVGGGTLRDVLVRRVPTVLNSGLYAVPAMVGAGIAVAAVELDLYGLPAAALAAACCFILRMVGVRYDLQAPARTPPEPPAAG